MSRYRFDENNSGGSWWLSKANYEALFAAGWEYTPSEYDIENGYDKKPFCDKGDTVPYGWRHNTTGEFASMQEAVESWERATGQDFFAEGCNCCGAPFSMSSEEPYEYMSGDDVRRETIRPW